MGHDLQLVSHRPVQHGVARRAHQRRPLHHRVENWLYLGRRGGDDPEDLGGGRLACQRLREIAIAPPELRERCRQLCVARRERLR